jgi:hypothetical protein
MRLVGVGEPRAGGERSETEGKRKGGKEEILEERNEMGAIFEFPGV